MRFFFANRKAAFRYPLGRAPRTAVLTPWFRPTDTVRIFPEGWNLSAAVYSPSAIAGTREQLLDLKDAHPTHAIIVLDRPGDPLLTATERDELWHRFRVPVFEQIVTEDGAVLAAECEAHDGLHVEADRDWQEYRVEPSCCACGLSTPRLTSSEPAERVRSAAAYAR